MAQSKANLRKTLLDEISQQLASSQKSSTPENLATKEEVAGMDVVDLVTYLMENKKLCSWGTAHSVARATFPEKFGEKFRQNDCGLLTAIFNAVTAGSDAMLVDRAGCYGKSAPVERHQAWLAENDFGGVKASERVQKVSALG